MEAFDETHGETDRDTTALDVPRKPNSISGEGGRNLRVQLGRLRMTLCLSNT